jgi:hypothetical protein
LSALADLEIALRQDCAYARLAESHAHRATREDSLSVTKSRDAITALWVAEGKQSITIDADLGDMIGYTVNDTWQGHRWVWREDGRILREVVIENRDGSKEAAPVHAPIGELRPAMGQFAAGDQATLPPGFPDAAHNIANRLHRAWNGRAFDQYDQPWLRALIVMLPDATFQFEHAIVDNGQTALLWRMMGHHQSGRRIRLIGSTIMADNTETSLFDQAAIKAQIDQAIIAY